MRLRDRLERLRPQSGTYRGEVLETLAINVLVAGTQVVTGVLLARVLGVEGRGELAAILALPTVVATFGMFGLQDAMIYFGARDRDRIGEYALSGTTLIVLLGIPLLVGSALFMPTFLDAHDASVIRASQVYLLLLVGYALTSFSTVAARAAHDITLWNRLRVIPNGLWLLVILGLWVAGRVSPARVAIVYIAAFFVFTAVAALPARRHLGRLALRASRWPSMLRYGLPLTVGGTPRILNERIDQVIIAGFLGAEDLGLYAVAVAWSGLMSLPGNAMSNVAFSKIAGLADAREQVAFVRRSLGTLILVTLGFGALLLVASPIAIPLIFSEEFAGAVPLGMILVGATWARAVSLMLGTCMMGVGRPDVVMYSEWGGLAALAATASLWVPAYGVSGAAWAVVAAAVAAMLIGFALFVRWMRRL